MHVTPRYHGDDLYALYASSASIMPPTQRAEYAGQLRNFMADWDSTAPYSIEQTPMLGENSGLIQVSGYAKIIGERYRRCSFRRRYASVVIYF